MKLRELVRLNNGELLAHVRSCSADTRAADLLKQRWEEFWEKGAVALNRAMAENWDLRSDRARLQIEAIELRRKIDRLETRSIEQHENDILCRENNRLTIRIAELEAKLRAKSDMHITSRDFVPIIPSFTIMDCNNVHPSRTEVARMARVLS